MTSLVIDASVAVEWFLPEELSNEALHIRDGFIEGEYLLIAPDLMLSEFVNVLWKSRELVDERSSLDIVRDLLALGIALVPSEQIIVRAYRIAREHNRTVHDAMYLALAASRNCGMVTADARLYHAVDKRLPFVKLLGETESAGVR